MQKIRLFNVAAAVATGLLLSAAAQAAPGWSATGLTVGPGDAGKVVAAFDALFDSRVGQNMPGRVSLRVNVADGANPETHTVVVLYKSAAEREAYEAELYASDAWAEFMSSMAQLNRAPGSSMRGVIAMNYGERSDDDVVWINHYVTVSEPAALLSAMRTFNASATGQDAPSQVHVSGVVAAGPGQPSHIISIGYASEAEMESWMERVLSDASYQVLLATLQSVSEYHGATLQREAKAWGKVSVEDVTDTGN